LENNISGLRDKWAADFFPPKKHKWKWATDIGVSFLSFSFRRKIGRLNGLKVPKQHRPTFIVSATNVEKNKQTMRDNTSTSMPSIILL